LKSIDITVAEEGHDGKVWHFGCIGGDLQALDKALEKLGAGGRQLHVVYEAGPCGFVIYRHLRATGVGCAVVAPAPVPKKASDRVKTDRRDSQKLAVQHRAGALQAIYVPEDEALRDLVRAREDAVDTRRRARQHVNSFLLRHGRHYGGKKKWSRAHRGWLAEQHFEHSAQRVRLCARFAHLSAARKHRNKINTAIARELTGFMWAIARAVAKQEAAALAPGAPQGKPAKAGTRAVYVLRRAARPTGKRPARKRVAA
jgi:hypothetical protein